MHLNDIQPCAGMTDMGAIIGLCVHCECRARPGPATLIPAARQDERGEWSCCERRFSGHVRILAPVQISGPPNPRGDGIVSVISRKDAA